MDRPVEYPSYDVYYDYRVDILRRRNAVTATLGGVQLAHSVRTLLVDEQNHGLVFYFPRADVALARLAPMPERSSVCPWKGTASYWRLAEGDDPVAWSYQAPHPQVAQIRDYIAFYQDKVAVALGVAPYLPGWKPRPRATRPRATRRRPNEDRQ